MRYYGIGGLGVDFRVFDKLELNFPFEIIQWIPPKHGEPLAHYVQRFSEKIDGSRPFILIGVSFGGIVAVELNKIVKPEQTILISSIASNDELPLIVKAIKKLHLSNILPHLAFKPPQLIVDWFFGIDDPESRKILNQILDEMEFSFLRWALGEIFNWKNTDVPENLIRIDGNADKIFPFKKRPNQFTVEDGKHLMIINKAKQISKILNKLVEKKIQK